jgi:hypothetical protein
MHIRCAVISPSTRVSESLLAICLFEETLMKHTRAGYQRPHAMYMPRSRGSVTGLLLILLGAWGALIPFIGPIVNWAYNADPAWTWTAAKGWLEVLPGVVTAVGGLLLFGSGNRATAMLGGWLAVFGGAWFVVGRAFAPTLGIGDVGQPVASTDLTRALLAVTYFTGLGALIVFLGGAVLARVAVRHARDVVVTEPAAGAPPQELAPYDQSLGATPARADHVAPAERERRGGGGVFHRFHRFHRRGSGGVFRRHHHVGV